jgi:hypothetical protein
MGTLAVGVRNAMLDALCRGVVFDNDEVWVKLHLGDPGAAGTSNPAAETTRKQATFGAAASGGAVSNTVALEWTALPAQETFTHVSFWSASTAGTFLGSDDLSSSAPVEINDVFRIPIGDLDVNLS